MGPSIIINYPPPPLWSNYEFHPLIKDRSANLFLFYEKEKQTKFHQKILGTDVATPPEMTFEEPLSPGFHCPSVWKHCPVEEYFSQRHLGGKGHP